MEQKLAFAPNVKEKLLENLLSIMGNIDLIELTDDREELLKIISRLRSSTDKLKQALADFEESIPDIEGTF